MAAEAGTTTLVSPAPVFFAPLRKELVPHRSPPILRGLTLTMAMGVFLTSCGFALSRASRPGAVDVYLVGQLLVSLAPAIFLIRHRTLTRTVGFLVTLNIGFATFLITQCYSPLQFRFQDEFQHIWTAQSILSTHHLFGYNPALPISSQYPGMEIATTAISSLSHLSISASGTIVAGLSHLLMTVLIYFLGIEIGLNARNAAFAVVIFSIGIDYQFFLSYFVYETFAMPFLLGTVILTLKMLKAHDQKSALFLGMAAVLLGFITITSHHVASYFMIAMLAAVVIWSAISRKSAQNIERLLVVFSSLVALVFIWDLGIATDTIHYLSQIRVQLLGPTGGIRTTLGGASQQLGGYVTGGHASPPQAGPAPWRVLAELSAAALAILIPFGAWRIWRARAHLNLFFWPAVAICFLYYELIPIYFLSPGAIELVGRSQVFILIPVGLVVAVALDSGRSPLSVPGPRHRLASTVRLRNSVLAIAALIIVVGALDSSWPPYSAKLPGPYQIAAYERSTDERTIASGTWIAQVLGPGKRLAADHREMLVLSAIGGAKGILGTASLFESESFRTVDAEIVRKLGIQIVITDSRMTRQLPAEGYLFDDDPLAGHYARPLPAAALTKFDAAPGVSRIFDDGVIVIYAMQGSK